MAKNLLSYGGNVSSLLHFMPDVHRRPLACHLHTVALVIGGVHQDLHLPSWLEGERVVQHPAVTGVDLPRLGMLPLSRHPGEHGVCFDAGDGSHHPHPMLLERFDLHCTPQEQADKAQQSDKKDDAWFQHLQTSSENKPFPVE